MTKSLPTSSELFRHLTAASAESRVIPRLAISLEALDKCGKTHWSLHTPPDPVLIVTNDPGTMHVVAKARRAGRTVHALELSYEPPDPSVYSVKDVDKDDWSAWKKQWKKFKDAMDALTRDKVIRTIVWDTGTGLWQLAQLSHFGKIKSIPQHLRTECNADYSGVFWDLYKKRPDLNMVLIHQLKKEYKPNSKGEADWTGGYERDGFNKIGFAVDLCLRAGWDGTQRSFYTEIQAGQATRYGADLCGTRWYGEESGFVELALQVFPETVDTPEVWGL